MATRAPVQNTISRTALVVLFFYIVLIYGYLVIRFDGQFIETDTSAQARIIHSADEAGSILHAETYYSNGFLYTAFSLFLIEVCGISVQTLQVYIYPLLTAFLFFPVFVTFRMITGRTGVAALATLLLFLQPDFLFVTWRGSHERLTWTLALLLIYVVAKMSSVRDLKSGATLGLLFYIFVFTLVSSNTFFASSYIVGLLLSFGGGTLILALRRRTAHSNDARMNPQITRLFYLVLSSLLLLYCFVFYLYSPAFEGLNALKYLWDKLILVLSGEVGAFNPYSTFLNLNWISPEIFLMITLFSWLVLLGSVVVWLTQVFNILRRKSFDETQMPRLFLLMLYAAFGFQMLASVIADRTDALTGNFQVRMFAPTMLVAVPLCSLGLWEALKYLKRRNLVLRVAVVVLPVLLIGWFSMASLLKASIEPVIGNKWIFTTHAEIEAGSWLVDHAASGSLAWTGMDERIVVGMYFQRVDDLPYESGPFRILPEPTENTDYLMRSYMEELRLVRNAEALPYFDDKSLIYDNGSVQLFYRRPQTIFQR